MASTVGAQTERFRISNFGGLGIAGGFYGTAGQVLTSGGNAAAPSWAAVALAAANFANPTASLGLAAVNGSAITAMRSDAAPALDVTISPTWSGSHTFSSAVTINANMNINSTAPNLNVQETDGAVDAKRWRFVADGGTWRFETLDDAAAVRKEGLVLTRNANSVTNVAFNNTTDNGTLSFRGTGIATFSGPIVMAAASGGSQGVGTVNATGLYINGVAVVAGGASVANPTGTIGLTAVNGVAATALRSDGAPALSQAIVPTWTGEHKFSGTLTGASFTSLNGISLSNSSGTEPTIWWRRSAGPLDQKNWAMFANPTSWDFTIYDDTGANSRGILHVDRAAGVITGLSFGNATNNPPYSFLGTGAGTFGGALNSGAFTATVADGAVAAEFKGATGKLRFWIQHRERVHRSAQRSIVRDHSAEYRFVIRHLLWPRAHSRRIAGCTVACVRFRKRHGILSRRHEQFCGRGRQRGYCNLQLSRRPSAALHRLGIVNGSHAMF